ncbi:hypothetical protein NCM_04011 [Burkholderia pseudomallei]
MLVSELSARAAHERAAKAWAGHYPQLSVEYALGREGNWNAQGGPTSLSSVNTDNFHGGQVNLSWELYAWGRPKSAMRKPMRWRKPKKTGTGARGI